MKNKIFTISALCLFQLSAIISYSQPCDDISDLTDDIYLIKNNGNHLRILQTSDGMFESPFGLQNNPDYATEFDFALCGDWDNDGRDDTYLIKNNGNHLRVLQTSDGMFESPFGLQNNPDFATAFDFAITGDWDNDGRDDIYLIKNNGNHLRILQTSDGTFESPFGLQNNPDFATAFDFAITGDWDNDGRDDIYLIKNNGNHLRILQTSDGTFESPFGLQNNPDFATGFDFALAGDWDNDGRDDIYLIKNNGNHLRILQTSDGTFESPFGLQNNPDFATAFDFALSCKLEGCMTVDVYELYDVSGISINKIFPNPVSEILKIEITAENNAELNMAILDLKGTVISQLTSIEINSGTQLFEMSAENLVNGIYFLELSSGYAKGYYKIIVAE